MKKKDKVEVGLFIPCYIDQLYPHVAIATLELLEKLGCSVHYPEGQTCCGQPLSNSGYHFKTGEMMDHFTGLFSSSKYIVSPSGSCTLHVKEHLKSSKDVQGADHIKTHIYELAEFIQDVLKVTKIPSSFPYKVGLHPSCHGLRGLRLAKSSELQVPAFNKTRQLLESIEDIQLMDLAHADECCGFGGTFAVFEEAISVKMGKDRIKDHLDHGVEVITGNDMSCLMHLEGIVKRDGTNVRVMHVAEILNGNKP